MARIGWHGSRKRVNGRYQARWRDKEGLRSQGGFIAKAQADTYALKMANEALNVQVGLAVFRKPIREARQAFIDRRTKENTRALNIRRVDEFLAAMPEVKDTSQLTRNLIDRYALTLERAGHNPGGQEHHLKIVRAFCKFCIGQKWITENPFNDFKMPKSDFEGRALSPEEWEKMVSPSRIPNQHKAADYWLNRAFRLGYATGGKRISQIWSLTPADFHAPDQLRIAPIKGQEPEWITLRPEASAILQELLPGALEHGRFFHYWATVESMRNSVEDKGRRVGLRVRFHDVCKVTAISDLSEQGFSLGDLAHISNTSKRVLVDHYIKADRKRAFARYLAQDGGKATATPGHTRATFGPGNGGFVAHNGGQQGLDGSKEKIAFASISPSIPNV